MQTQTSVQATWTFTCDQDGTTATVNTTDPYQPAGPEGWVSIMDCFLSTGVGLPWQQRHTNGIDLCPTCAASWAEGIKAFWAAKDAAAAPTEGSTPQ